MKAPVSLEDMIRPETSLDLISFIYSDFTEICAGNLHIPQIPWATLRSLATRP